MAAASAGEAGAPGVAGAVFCATGAFEAGAGPRSRKNHAPPPSNSTTTTTAAAIIGSAERFGAVAPACAAADVAAGRAAAGAADADPGAGRRGAAATIVASESSASSGTAAASERPDAAACNASRNSVADWNRSSGRLAIALRTTPSNACGQVTLICDGSGGSVFSALCMIADMPPSNGRSPVSNWYSSTPDE